MSKEYIITENQLRELIEKAHCAGQREFNNQLYQTGRAKRYYKYEFTHKLEKLNGLNAKIHMRQG